MAGSESPDTAALVQALELATDMLACVARAAKLNEAGTVCFTGRWAHFGTVSLGEVLDKANDALAPFQSKDIPHAP